VKVQINGPGGARTAAANDRGQYVFDALRPGKYLVRAGAKGFAIFQRQDLEISAPSPSISG
jgi:protocatechuate 3,4-dioxygenase beta subunit